MNTTFQILTLTDLKIINERIRGSGPYTNEISMSDSRNNAVLAPPFCAQSWSHLINIQTVATARREHSFFSQAKPAASSDLSQLQDKFNRPLTRP